MLEFGLRLTLHNKVKKGGLLKKSLDREKETEKGERDKKEVSDITGGGGGGCIPLSLCNFGRNVIHCTQNCWVRGKTFY